MAQIGRAIKRTFLQAMPDGIAAALLQKYPNLRKAAPPGKSFVFRGYCSDISVNIDTRFKVERIMWSGTYEPPLAEFLDSRNTNGWVCIDIGANVGAISLLLAKLTGAEGKVFAIEPGPPNVTRLRANFELNPELSARTEIVACGMGRSRSELWWAEEKDNPGNAMLAQEGSHRIPVDTLDNFVREHDLDDLDFIKIDVEGMELDVMQGGKQTLLRYRPMLYFETLARYGDVHSGSNFQMIESFLTGVCGYELFRISHRGELQPVGEKNMDDYTVAIHRDRKM
jgi:FkbM family methyltransferase